jgi:predicted dehydrogenase
MKVGIVGCGVISANYAKGARGFDSYEIVACADLDRAMAETLAAEHGYEVAAVDELLADPAIDVVLNLTPPGAHAAVLRDALAAGKHVYTEKPLTAVVAEGPEILDEADRRGLRIGCAPDIFLGSAYQAARALIDEGAIGQPISASATCLVGGQSRWHPNPDIFYRDGAGPLLDMGPYYLTSIVALLGPVKAVTGIATTLVAERRIEIGPRKGETFGAFTPTHTAAVLELETGPSATLIVSFEAPTQYYAQLGIHGADGVLELPDPNYFGGPVRLAEKRMETREVPYESRGGMDTRGIGLHDLVLAVAEERPHRASGRLGHHVVDVARTILRAAEEGRRLEVTSSVEQPAPMPVA